LIIKILILSVFSLLIISCDTSTDSKKGKDVLWVYYTSDPDGCSYYYDSNSIKYLRDNKIVKVKRKVECPGRKESTNVMTIDCSTGKYHEKTEALGGLIQAETGSVHDPIEQLVCFQ
jgi:hypothetical protein